MQRNGSVRIRLKGKNSRAKYTYPQALLPLKAEAANTNKTGPKKSVEIHTLTE
jgi:hypothetical protein